MKKKMKPENLYHVTNNSGGLINLDLFMEVLGIFVYLNILQDLGFVFCRLLF